MNKKKQKNQQEPQTSPFAGAVKDFSTLSERNAWQFVLDKVPVPAFLYQAGEFVYCNDAFCRLFLLSEPGSAPLNSQFERIFPHYYEGLVEKIKLAASTPGERSHFMLSLTTNNQIKLELETELLNIELEKSPTVLGFFQDRTPEANAEEMARCIFHLTGEGILVADKLGTIMAVNPAFSTLTGFSEEELVGKKTTIFESGRHDLDFYARIQEKLEQDGKWEGEIWNKRKNGTLFLCWVTVNAVQNKKGEVIQYIGTLQDITSMKKIERDIEYLSHYDALTSLPNRVLFQDKLMVAIHQAQRQEKILALLYLNLDRFKKINDTMGHILGDLLLIEVAQRLKEVITSEDFVSRFGGDDFVLVISNYSDPRDIIRLVKKIVNIFNHPFTVKDRELFLTVSVGISLYPEDGEGIKTLLKNAEIAMQRAKDRGGNQYQFYRPEMDLRSMENLLMESDLRKALGKNEFLLYFQPLIDLSTQKLIGAEALIRWDKADAGIIQPGSFINLAEEIGTIIPIGKWVLYSACMQTKLWQDAGHVELSVSVNLSVKQFRQENVVEMIREVLEHTGLAAKYLTLEITESIIILNSEKAKDTLSRLKNLGVNIAIDDFGTGYSSLSYLKNFPVDKLKIDKSFVKDIPSKNEDVAIIDTIITLGHNLNIKVIAEGVETLPQLELLQKLGCDEVQGYYYSVPLPAEDFAEFFLREK